MKMTACPRSAGAVALLAALWAGAPARAEMLSIKAQSADAAAVALGTLENYDIALLDLSLEVSPEQGLFYRTRAGGDAYVKECAFGPLDAVGEISPSLPDNHLLVTIRIGDPERHAANAAFCEYAGGPPIGRLAVRGCYLALSFSVPTARQLLLNPLPASACGLHP